VVGVDVVADPAGVRQRIGYIGQKDGAGYNYRVRDELLMQGRFYGLSKDESVRRGTSLLASLDLEGLEMRKVSTLSGGQKRRLDIALGLIHEPALLFLDEPSTGMDPQNRANLWEHITRLREERGTTIVLTTHYLEEADSMAERVVVIDHGRIIADDTAEALKAEQAGDRIALTVGAADASTVRAVVDQVGSELTESRTGDGLRIDFRVDRATRTLPRLVHTLGDKGVDVLEASAHQPTLDDVFLNLTGRSLREAVETGAEA
jgi:ABC-2 type transport system ATP-binding protein